MPFLSGVKSRLEWVAARGEGKKKGLGGKLFASQTLPAEAGQKSLGRAKEVYSNYLLIAGEWYDFLFLYVTAYKMYAASELKNLLAAMTFICVYFSSQP